MLRLLETRDYVQVAELSQAFAVSEVTVRSDLGQLARQGLVARIRGGARALQHGQSEVGFDLRMRLEVDAKLAIARAAADEAFLLGTTVEITPVVKIDDNPIGGGRPGPVTRRLQEAFEKLL